MKTLRLLKRTTVLILIIVRAFLDFATLRRPLSHRDRTAWLHRHCRRALKAIGVEFGVRGRVPASGLIVSNHLSYLDILVFSAIVPCSFVSKSEVRDWPVFGTFAKLSGTVFVERESRMDAHRAYQELTDVLKNGEPVVLFPEGTTTDASKVLPFRPSMFQAALDSGCDITPAAINYWVSDGSVGQEVCYWGDMTLVPHAANLFSKKWTRCSVVFGEPLRAEGDRKELATASREHVVEMFKDLNSAAPSSTAAHELA